MGSFYDKVYQDEKRRLQSHISREYKGKKYHKHWIIIPNRLLEKLGWDEGEELKAEIKNKKLVVEKD